MKRRHDYSQNFLRSPKLVQTLLSKASIQPGDMVYDIGAGSGVITTALADIGCEVIAVELEQDTLKTLRRNTATHPNVTVVEADFLTITLPDTPYKVFSNIPFHLSAEIVRKLTVSPNPPAASYLIVQKQFANRLLPDFHDASSQLGMSIGPVFSIRVLRDLKRTDFWPHPNVDTVLLEIAPRKEVLIHSDRLTAYQQFVADAFTNPDFFAKLAVPRRAIQPGVKPSQLSLSEWLVLFLSSESS